MFTVTDDEGDVEEFVTIDDVALALDATATEDYTNKVLAWAEAASKNPHHPPLKILNGLHEEVWRYDAI